ncbi:PadR family transcriptional regulator [Longispora sp. K20-0274]|uniref:PadR family transcriptional regulator n=1 Tax=Longispora sp. K20-0274 TaxID=3088255 RepID=UPI00399B6C0A
MALEHAIVVSLLEKPGTGYELARRFDRSIGFFWAASHQQIYRTLHRMTADGWVDITEVPDEAHRVTKVYTVTDAGRAALAEWMRAPSEPEQHRSDLGVKVRGAAFDDPAVLVADVTGHRDAHAERLALYTALEERDFPAGEPRDTAARLQHLVLRAGIRYEQGWLAWCEEVLTELGEMT